MDFLPVCIYALQHKFICETNCGQIDDTSTGRLPGVGLLCVWDVHSMPLELDKSMVNYTSECGRVIIHLLCFQAV